MKEKQKRQEVIDTQAGTLLTTQEEKHQFQELSFLSTDAWSPQLWCLWAGALSWGLAWPQGINEKRT